MSTSFVYNGKDTIIATHFSGEGVICKLIVKPEIISVAVQSKGKFIPVVGVNNDGTFVSLSDVPECAEGKYKRGFLKIGDLANDLLIKKVSFQDAKKLIKAPIVNDPNSSSHMLAADTKGNVLVVEPGRGAELQKEKYHILSNFAVYDVEGTKADPANGYDRYKIAVQTLSHATEKFNEISALSLIRKIDEADKEMSKFAMVYIASKNAVMVVENGDYAHPKTYRFPAKRK